MSIQQFLTIGGLMIFSLANLSINTSSVDQQTSTYFNEAALIATGLGKSMLEEIVTTCMGCFLGPDTAYLSGHLQHKIQMRLPSISALPWQPVLTFSRLLTLWQ